MDDASGEGIIMMELIARHTVSDESTLEKLAVVTVGVYPDENSQFTGLNVMLQIDDNKHWAQKQELTRRREIMAGLIHNLALDIKERFLSSGRDKDLEIAITLHRKALELTPNTRSYYSLTIINLSKALEARYDHAHQPADLDLVIACCRTLLAVWRPPLHPLDPSHLSRLADALGKRYNIERRNEDLDQNILLRRQALELTQSGSIDYIDALRILSQVLSIRYRHRGDENDLDEAIELQRRAMNLGYSSDDEDVANAARTDYIGELAGFIYPRFRLSHRVEDMEELINLFGAILEQQLDPQNPKRESTLTFIALLLHERFRHAGNIYDLDLAVSYQLQLLKFRGASDHNSCGTLINLSSMMYSQFMQSGNRKYLDEAAVFLREALLPPITDNNRRSILNNLSIILRERFEETNQQYDLNEAIDLETQALSIEPSSKEDRTSSLINLGAALWSRYQPATGTKDELAIIVSHFENALSDLPAAHPYRAILVGNLGNILRACFDKTQRREELDRAIELLQEALNATDPSHPENCVMSSNLGLALCQLHASTKDPQHLEEGMVAFRRAATHPNAALSKKFVAARNWAEQADFLKHVSALDAYRAALELLPLLVTLDAGLEHRQQRLMSNTTRTDGLAVAAAGCALKEGNLEEAVEFLEEGRSVFWNQAMRLRSPMGDLEMAHPELAERLRSVRKKLEIGSFGGLKLETSSLVDRGLSTDHQESMRLRRLTAEWDTTLAEIRHISGFQTFLQPRGFTELQKCAIHGPVLSLCMTNTNGYAVIMTSNALQHLSLPYINLRDVTNLARVMRGITASGYSRDSLPDSLRLPVEDMFRGMPELEDDLEKDRYGKKVLLGIKLPSASTALKLVLKVLWVRIVEPIIRVLNLKKSSNPLRVFWCPTGPLTFLPIHAAGIYEDAPTSEGVSDYMISSYIPTISTIIGNQDRQPQDSDFQKILAIVQPESLPGALQELRNIEKHFEYLPPQSLIKLGNDHSNPATISAVLHHLSTAPIVHFACHGRQYIGNPLESALLLENGQLSLARIMQQDMKNARLAFLCACETATGEKEVPDESMHLGGALLFAGFQGVVATMWSIADVDGPKVADEFYRNLVHHRKLGDRGEKSRISTDEAAQALHLAILKLRSGGAPLERWVPFVYLGI